MSQRTWTPSAKHKGSQRDGRSGIGRVVNVVSSMMRCMCMVVRCLGMLCAMLLRRAPRQSRAEQQHSRFMARG
jgi:hypothetical protein